MKRCNLANSSIFFTATVAILFFGLPVGFAASGKANPEPGGKPKTERTQGIVPDQYIVTFHEDVSDPRGLANAFGQLHGFALRRTYQHALKGFAARMPASVARALASDPDVAMIEPDLYANTTAQTIPTGVARIGATLNSTPLDCSGVNVAIIDTGIDLDHPDLHVVGGRNFNAANDVGDGNDDAGHGTHVAGIVGAKDNDIGVVGVCPGASLWAVKVLDSTGSGLFSDIIQGIDFVTANAPGANPPGPIAVANMSLGGIGYLASLRTAIQNSVNKGSSMWLRRETTQGTSTGPTAVSIQRQTIMRSCALFSGKTAATILFPPPIRRWLQFPPSLIRTE